MLDISVVLDSFYLVTVEIERVRNRVSGNDEGEARLTTRKKAQERGGPVGRWEHLNYAGALWS